MESWAAEKSFKLVWRRHQLLSGFLTNGHLPRVSRQSCLTVNDEGDNEMIPGAVTDLLAFTLQLRKTSARRSSMKAVPNG